VEICRKNVEAVVKLKTKGLQLRQSVLVSRNRDFGKIYGGSKFVFFRNVLVCESMQVASEMSRQASADRLEGIMMWVGPIETERSILCRTKKP
jgi:hypothetical protein